MNKESFEELSEAGNPNLGQNSITTARVLEMGGTGDPPVPVGESPTGMKKSATLF
jgi:hypothetical protein